MILRKIVSEGISHNSYFISAGGRAAVIDPRRDVDVYLDLAREAGVQITHGFETHRNEDYVIGSVELAEWARFASAWLDEPNDPGWDPE